MASNRLAFLFRILKMFREKKHKNQFNVSFARLIFIKTFSISWFDTHKDFSPEELIRQIIPDNFFRKPNGPPNDGFVLCLHSLWTIIGKFNLSFLQECYVWKLLAASDYVIAIICHYLFVFKTEKKLKIFLNVYSMHDKLLHWEALISALVSNIGNTLRRNFNIFHKDFDKILDKLKLSSKEG